MSTGFFAVCNTLNVKNSEWQLQEKLRLQPETLKLAYRMWRLSSSVCQMCQAEAAQLRCL